MNIKNLVSLYLDDMALAWSASTLSSEKYRLSGVASLLEKRDAKVLWDYLVERGDAPYTRATVFTRVVAFYEWCIEEHGAPAPNPYKVFRRKYAKQFKNVYEKKIPQLTFEEAKARISTISDDTVRNKAMQLLLGGLRWTESGTVQDGKVVGKGGKVRNVYVAGAGGSGSPSYDQVRKALKEVGLKPHCLRKLFAGALRKQGADAFELCKAMGWASIATAQSYIEANDDELARKVRSIQSQEGTNEVSEGIRNRG